jgi:NAD(P)-dependent dehydrogenase (short-subunit alcohol dehydrogenase family)
MGYSVEGKNVLVTGGSSGIGAALAEGFAERGATVGICARRRDRLAEVLERCRKHSPGSRSWVVDLADLDGVSEFAATAERQLGGIDVLVNNAGIPKRRDVQRLTPEVVESTMALNYFSPIRLTLALLPGLISRGGRIVNISSVAARLGPPGEAAYSATKAALTAFSESMAVDLRDTDVLVHVVNPGVIDTDLFHLPDNDEGFHAAVDALPVEAIVQPIVDQLDSGTFEIYVPEWFQDITSGKFSNPQGYLDGTKEYARTLTVPDL